MDAALEQETIEIARDLIRIESVNTGDPATIGDGEERAARYVRDRLAEVGISGEFLLPTPGRGNFIVRIPGRDRSAGRAARARTPRRRARRRGGLERAAVRRRGSARTTRTARCSTGAAPWT
jgi:acetylornithine deacetylase/succinyl-diaminopimelate desuccinylase-like protein